MKKILLINPPFYRVLGSHYNGLSLGLGYIASVLNNFGHDAWVYNADFQMIDSYKLLYNVYKDFPNYIEIFKDKDHEIWNETIRSILKFNPDWIGWTSYTANVSAIQILSEKVKFLIPNCKQVIGGVQATLDPYILNKFPHIDFATHREGEYAFLDLVNEKNINSIKGVSFKVKENIQFNGNADFIDRLDELPHPERKKLWTHDGPITNDQRRYFDVSYMITLRGCPYRCTFCASPEIWGRKNLRYRDPSFIIDEMQHIKNNYWDRDTIDYSILSQNSKNKTELLQDAVLIKDNSLVYFVDDVFTLKKQKCIAIMQKMIDENLNIPWKCESRADNIDQEIADKMAESGCVRVKVGIESGSDRMLKIMKKDETKDDIRKGINYLKNAGVSVSGHLLTGFPEETDDDLQETIDFAKELDIDYYSLSILSPYYGTKIYYDSIQNGFELDKQPWEYFFHHSKKMMVNKNLSEKKLEEFWRLCDVKKYK